MKGSCSNLCTNEQGVRYCKALPHDCTECETWRFWDCTCPLKQEYDCMYFGTTPDAKIFCTDNWKECRNDGCPVRMATRVIFDIPDLGINKEEK